MASPAQIESALGRVKDQGSFLCDLLTDTLDWPVAESIERVEDIAYGWSDDDLQSQGLIRSELEDGQAWQFQPFRGDQPWGIFLLQFSRPAPFTARGGLTGATGVLRKILRGLVPKARRNPALKSWQRENLLFICTHNYKQFRFAYFKAPRDKTLAAPLAFFGWNQGDTHVRTLCEHNLPALAFSGDWTAEQWLAKWSAAFDVEAVTKRFFAEYAEVFHEVEDNVKGVPKGEARRLYTQRLFNRLMFLYFIQRKGWLSFQGDRGYLRALFSAATLAREDFLNDRLYWTFFAGLNTPNEDKKLHAHVDLKERRGEVPFLNGGLFDLEDDYDVREKVHIPNAAFAKVLALFERYNFTVTESTPLDVEVAVDPEMLGKVFEELVTGRHESGSYYTPRPIVAFMCREALKHYLHGRVGGVREAHHGEPEGRVGEVREAHHGEPVGSADSTHPTTEAIARFVDDGDPSQLPDPEAVLNALRAVKVCDPACGSGAYLLGMMQELLRLREALFATKGLDAVTVYKRKLEIIQNNLYGVDIDLFAVNIAKLRLWLSLAVDFEGKTPPPLPNLDFKIECGDSLTAPDPQEIPDLFRRLLVETADRLTQLKAEFLSTYGANKKKLSEQIRKEEAKLRESLHQQEPTSAVDWRVGFAEAFKVGGFDIVLANPPYGLINKRQNQQFGHTIAAETVLLFKASDEYKPILRGMVNVCSLFIRRSFSLLREKGVFVEIFPLAFACDWSYGLLRAHILRHHTLRSIDAFPERDDTRRRVFASAKMSVCIMVSSRGVAIPQLPFLLRIHHQPFVDLFTPAAVIYPTDLPQFDANCSIPLVKQTDVHALKTIYSRSQRLRDIGRCYTGEIDLTQSRRFIRQESRYSPMYKGAIIDRYRIREKMSQGEIEYLDKATFLAARGSNANSNAWHHKRTRIVLQGITGINESTRLKMTIIPPGTFLANSANYILLDDPASEQDYHFVLGVLNSRTANYVFKCFSTNSNVNGYEVDNLPVPRVSAKDKERIASLSSTCLELYGTRKDAKGTTVQIDRIEHELEERVAAAYGVNNSGQLA